MGEKLHHAQVPVWQHLNLFFWCVDLGRVGAWSCSVSQPQTKACPSDWAPGLRGFILLFSFGAHQVKPVFPQGSPTLQETILDWIFQTTSVFSSLYMKNGVSQSWEQPTRLTSAKWLMNRSQQDGFSLLQIFLLCGHALIVAVFTMMSQV